MDAIYSDDAGGGPERSNVVAVMVSHINRRLARQGYKIRGSGGPGSVYLLEEV